MGTALVGQTAPAPGYAEAAFATGRLGARANRFIYPRQTIGDRRAPSAEADHRTLIRRMTFDLTGLPPTPAEIAAFEAAAKTNRDQAIAALADRLLASPRYGERWGRHWLDVVKYADTCGYDKDKLRPNAILSRLRYSFVQ